VSIIDSGINLSNHCAVNMNVCVPCQHLIINESQDSYSHSLNDSLPLYGTKVIFVSYFEVTYEVTRDALNTVQVPTDLLVGCPSRLDSDYITAVINLYHDNIIHALCNTSLSCIPEKHRSFNEHWWDEKLTLLKEPAIHSFKLWAALCKPRNGKKT